MILKLISTCGLILITTFSFSQSVIQVPETTSDSTNMIYTKVEEEAEFPGEPKAFEAYTRNNLNTEIPTTNNAPAGTYTIIVRFLVSKDGTISDVFPKLNLVLVWSKRLFA